MLFHSFWEHFLISWVVESSDPPFCITHCQARIHLMITVYLVFFWVFFNWGHQKMDLTFLLYLFLPWSMPSCIQMSFIHYCLYLYLSCCLPFWLLLGCRSLGRYLLVGCFWATKCWGGLKPPSVLGSSDWSKFRWKWGFRVSA